MYQIKKNKSFYYSILILKYCYTVPKTDEEPYITRFKIIFLISKLLAFILFFVLPGIHTIITLRGNTGVDISEDLSTMLGSISAIVTSCCFLALYEKWMQFFRGLEDCKKFGTPSDFGGLQKKLNLYSISLASYIAAAVVIYAAVSAKETSYCKRFNEEHGLNEICGLFSPIILPFDGNSIYVRIFIFGLQMSIAMTTLVSGIVICYLPYEGAETLRAHLNLLKQCFNNVFEATDDEERRDRLRFCVSYHINVLGLCQQLSILVKYTSGNLCVTCALVFGCIGNLILKSKPLSGTCYLLGYIAALFMVCHGGQKIIDETLSVTDAVYNSKWHEGDAKIMRDVRFVLVRSQIPITMNALPLGVMNYSLFLLIMKTSYTYFTLLSQNT